LGAPLSPDIDTGNLLLPVMLGASGKHFPITHPAPVRKTRPPDRLSFFFPLPAS